MINIWCEPGECEHNPVCTVGKIRKSLDSESLAFKAGQEVGQKATVPVLVEGEHRDDLVEQLSNFEAYLYRARADLADAKFDLGRVYQRERDRNDRDLAIGRAITSWLEEYTDEGPEHVVVNALLGILTTEPPR